MNWITREQVKEAAAKGTLEALQCSLKHHRQGRDALKLGLINAIVEGEFYITSGLCACCEKSLGATCTPDNGCPLEEGTCCGGLWLDLADAFSKFATDHSNANFEAFQKAEADICAYIEGKIVEEKPELKHGDYGVDEDNDPCFMVGTQKAGSPTGLVSVGKGAIAPPNATYKTRVVYGNLIDDLKAMSEDVGGFEVESYEKGEDVYDPFEVYIDDGDVVIDYDTAELSIPPVQLHDFILKLRQMEATLKRRQNAK